MPLNAQTAKLVVTKKISEQASAPPDRDAATARSPRQHADHRGQRQRGIDHGHHPPVVEAE